MPFLNDLVVRETREHVWELTDDLVYEGRIEVFHVPRGFTTDLASVPRVFLWLVPNSGRYTKAAVLHDWLCERAARGEMLRSDADGIFRRAMRELGVPKLRRGLMWAAVRTGNPATLFEAGVIEALRVIGLLALVSPALLVAVPAVAVLLALYVVEWLVYAAQRLRGLPESPPVFNWWNEPTGQ